MVEKLKQKGYDLLRYSERYTKTDMIYLTKGGFWLVSGNISNLIIGIILTIAFANLLSKETLGTYQFIISIASLISIFTLSGMGTATMQSAAKEEGNTLPSAFKNQLKWNTGIFIVGIIISAYYFINQNNILAIAFLIASVSQPLIVGLSLYKPYLTGKQLFKGLVIAEFVNKVITFIALLIVILKTDSVLVITGVFFAVQTTVLFVIYKYINHKHRSIRKTNTETINYAKHLSIMESFGNVAGYLDKILIWHFLGAVPVAIYTLAQLPIIHLQNTIGLIKPLSFAKIVQKDITTIKQILPKRLSQYSLFVAIIALAYILGAPIIFKVFFPQYIDSVIYSQFLALTLLATPRKIISQVFIAHKAKKEQYILNITSPTIRIVTLLIMLPIYGIAGVVMAMIITEMITMMIQWQLFKKLQKND